MIRIASIHTADPSDPGQPVNDFINSVPFALSAMIETDLATGAFNLSWQIVNPWADWWALIELKTDEARDHEHEVAPGGAHSHGVSQAPSHTHSYSDQDGKGSSSSHSTSLAGGHGHSISQAPPHGHGMSPAGGHFHLVNQMFPNDVRTVEDQNILINAPSPFRHTRPFASFTDAITPPVNGRAHGIFYVRALISVNNRPGNFAKSDDYWFRVGQ
jgi:hypothetical protein